MGFDPSMNMDDTSAVVHRVQCVIGERYLLNEKIVL